MHVATLSARGVSPLQDYFSASASSALPPPLSGQLVLSCEPPIPPKACPKSKKPKVEGAAAASSSGEVKAIVVMVQEMSEKLLAKEAGATDGFDAETVAHLQQLAAGLVDDEVWSPTANTYNLCFNISVARLYVRQLLVCIVIAYVIRHRVPTPQA